MNDKWQVMVCLYYSGAGAGAGALAGAGAVLA